MTAAIVDLSFPHRWHAEILTARPLILPQRHFVYPRQADEVERGALEVLVRPIESNAEKHPSGAKALIDNDAVAARVKSCPVTEHFGHIDFVFRDERDDAKHSANSEVVFANAGSTTFTHQPFLATCALGFRDPAVPTGLWSTPEPEKICAVSGGYAYIIDTTAPEEFTMIPYRPVLEVRPALAPNLLLFVGHYSVLAWGRDGQAWQSAKLSDEGVTITAINAAILHGRGWEMISDRETPFALDLNTGLRTR